MIAVLHRRLRTLVPNAHIYFLLTGDLFFRRIPALRVGFSGYCRQLYRTGVDKSFCPFRGRRLSSLTASASDYKF